MPKTAKTKEKPTDSVASAPATTPDDEARDFFLQEAIEVRAYEIYRERGATEGQALDDWLQAEREILELSRRAPGDEQ